jgi:zinc/manganese transport system permease protein
MTNAWEAATIVAVVAGAVGFFVVLRGAAFAAHAIPKGAFAGAAAAYWLGLNELVGLGLTAGLAAAGIGSLGERNRRDVATALGLVTLLALGSLFLSFSGSSTALVPIAAVGLACLVALGVSYRPLMLSTVVPDVAEARGVRARPTEIGFLLVVAAATTVTLPVVGALLIFSLMIGPPAAARALTRRPVLALMLSVVLALLTAWAAIASSYQTNWPVGFFVGAYGAACFVGGRLWAGVARRVVGSAGTGAPSPAPAVQSGS